MTQESKGFKLVEAFEWWRSRFLRKILMSRSHSQGTRSDLLALSDLS